jgi:hypothetical protein
MSLSKVVTGGIRTHFFDNAASRYDFPKTSIFDPLREDLEPVIRGDNADAMLESEQTLTPPPFWAH